jgi:branched-chain amino acid transport system permease protein
MGAAVAAALPFALTNFAIFQLTLAMTYAIAILGLNILSGFNGQFSLGHSSFFALGAYITAILLERAGVSFYWTLPVAGAACFVTGFLFGWPAARLEGIYLALATFSLGVATPQILKSSVLEPWTGGVQGIALGKIAAPFATPLGADRWLYLVTLAILAMMFGFAGKLMKSRTGRAMMAIRDNPLAAQTAGIDITFYRSLAFGISALYAGIAGALVAVAIGFVAPDSFTFLFSIALFVGLAVGGAGSIWGTLIGGLFILFVPNIAGGISRDLAGAAYGVILITVIYLMPTGAAGLGRAIVKRLAG